MYVYVSEWQIKTSEFDKNLKCVNIMFIICCICCPKNRLSIYPHPSILIYG